MGVTKRHRLHKKTVAKQNLNALKKLTLATSFNKHKGSYEQKST